ncbi:MAG TPA: SET domain-containing protein [Terriglobales bacterium]|nr:SET domain-containing protein [Terriglobales bacterium]
MSGKSALSKVNRRQLRAVPGGAAESSLAGGLGSTPVAPPVSYLVTFDVSSGSIVYDAIDQTSGAHVNPDLKFKQGDKVAWQAKTNTPNHRWAVQFPPSQTPFGNVYAFSGTQANEPVGGTIAEPSPGPVSYKYFVVVVEDPAGAIYTDDPRIIVGNSATKGKLIIAAEDEVREAARLNSALSEKIDSISFVPISYFKTRLPHVGVFVRLKPSRIHGIGVFAIKDIPKETCVFRGDNQETVWVKASAIKGLGREVKKFYRDFCISCSGRYGCPRNFNMLTPAWYLNHSKKPNMALDKNYGLISTRKIGKGEELTVDYETYNGCECVYPDFS